MAVPLVCVVDAVAMSTCLKGMRYLLRHVSGSPGQGDVTLPKEHTMYEAHFIISLFLFTVTTFI
jgi:hypothetical protein